MTIRFNTWIEADSLEEAWEKLRLSLTDKNLGDRLKKEFTATILEDGERDKKELAPLTVKELRDYLKTVNHCEGCPMSEQDGCRLDKGCISLMNDRYIDEMTKAVRGERE